ncbi:TIGR04086 family membrane protein [Bacillus tequilensis]|uniref:TIGR04086 family membrane protein n=2 Tax=Bacillus tequilensis TaxID=227866 RepID=A0A6H0WL35_9BACI|nr:TIGR04086 family membrane protein [Bacillus tequilensis]
MRGGNTFLQRRAISISGGLEQKPFNTGREETFMEETKQVGKGILYGLIAIFSAMLLTSLAVSLLLTATSLEESSFNWLINAISFLSLFIGGFISGGKGKERGWMIGAMTALSFSMIILLFQYLGFGKTFTAEQLLFHLGFLGVCMLGGIFGVNMRGNRSST